MYFSIAQLDPLISIIPEVPNGLIPSPVDGQPIWDSNESTLEFSSPDGTSTPALSFINGKQEVSIEPEKTYAEKEARGYVFETVSSTLQNLTVMEEKVETSSNFDYSLVDSGATQDGPLVSSQGTTYPVPITPPSSQLLDHETETLMEEGLLPHTPSGITTERLFSPKPHQPSAVPTNETETTVAPSKPIDTIEEISLPSEDGSGQETATIQVIQVTQKSITLQATESDKLDHTMIETSEKKPLLPSLTDATDITYSASSYWTTELGIKDYTFTTEAPMSATPQADNMSIPDTTEKPAITKSTIMVTSSPGMEGITSIKPLFIAEVEGSSGETHDLIFAMPTVQHTVTKDFDAMTPHRPQTPDSLVLQTEEPLLATPSKVNIIDSSENTLSTQEEQQLSATGTVPTVEKTSKDAPSVSVLFSEADGSGDQSDVMSTITSSTVYPLHTTTHSEQIITTPAVYTFQTVDETASVKMVSVEMETNQATVSPSAYSSSFIAMETTTKPVRFSDISEKVIQETFTAAVQVVMTEEGSGDQSPTAETMATAVPSKSSEVPVTDDSELVFSTENTEKDTTDKPSVESISQGLPSTISESLLLFPDTEGSGNQISDSFTQTTTTIATATTITSHAFSTQPSTIRYEETSVVQVSNTDSKESHITSAPTQDMSQSEGSGEESGEFEDGVSGDFYNTVVESTPPSQAPSTDDVSTTKSGAVIETEFPIHPTVPITVTSTVIDFTASDGSGDQNVDTHNTVSVTSPTSVTTDASKEFSVRTDEAEISYTKSTLDYSDVKLATLSTTVTSESTSQIPSVSAQTESLSSSLESGSGDTEETTIESEGTDDGSGDAVSTVLESSPPFVSPAVEHVTLTPLAEIKYEGTVDDKDLIHAKGSEMPTTEVNTEFSVKTDEAETSENKATLDFLNVETSTQYTLFKTESTSDKPNLAISSDIGSGDMEDTTSEGTEDEGSADDSSGALIESAAPSQSPSADITTQSKTISIHTGIKDLPLVVPTSTSTDSVALTTEDSLGKQSTVTTVPMITGTDSSYLTSKHVDIDSVVLTTDFDKETLKVLVEDGGSGDEMLVTATSELPRSTSATNLPTESPYTTTAGKVSVQTKSVATDTDVTTPVLSVIYQDSTDKEVTVVPSSSEIRSSKITARLHDTKSITSPVIIFTEEVKDEEKLFSTVTDSMRDHSAKIEITTKDDNIIDADTASPASSFASTIITEEAAGITAVTITPHSSSILTEEPEGSGTDKPVFPSSDLHLEIPSFLEGTATNSVDLSSSVKAEEIATKSTFTVDIHDEGFTAHTVSPSKMTPHLSTSTHSAQTTLLPTHSTTHYNTEKSHPSQAGSHMAYSTNQPTFTTSDSVYTTSQHSPIITAQIHTTTSQPKSIFHLTSTTSHSEFRTTQAMSMTSNLIEHFSGDSDSEIQTLNPAGTTVSTDTSSEKEQVSTMAPSDEFWSTTIPGVILDSDSVEELESERTSLPLVEGIPERTSASESETLSPLLSEESSGDRVSEIFMERSTTVSVTDHRDFSTTHSDVLLSRSEETDSTSFAPPAVTTSRFYPDTAFDVTLVAQPTKSPSAADDLSTTTTTSIESEEQETAGEIEKMDYTTSSADGDTTASPEDISDDTMLVDPETLNGTQTPGLNIDLGYTVVGETYNIAGMTFSRPNDQCFPDYLYYAYVLIIHINPSIYCYMNFFLFNLQVSIRVQRMNV